MKFLIVAFKSRNNLQAFVKIVKQMGIAVSIINTPRSISVSCGLSCRIDFRHLNFIVSLIQKNDFNDVFGVYVITRNGIYEQVEKFY